MKINEFSTKNGRDVRVDDFTVFVGPNNAGKSQTLRDIRSIVASYNNPDPTIIDNLDFQLPDGYDDAVANLETFDPQQDYQEEGIRGLTSELQGSTTVSVRDRDIKAMNNGDEETIMSTLGQFYVSFLDASSRLEIAGKTDSYDTEQGHAQDLVQRLLEGDRERGQLRKAFKDTFGQDIRLDDSNYRDFILRVDEDFADVEEGVKQAPESIRRYGKLDDQGDGYKSFAGIILSLLFSEDRIVLIDEPSAFLHPPQARDAGRLIANIANQIPEQVVVATHNSNFLSGVLRERRNVCVYRLNRSNDHTEFNRISSETTKKLSSDPLLSTQRVIEAAFNLGVVVCEADSDKLIYQSVAVDKLQSDELMFVHAHNKQTIHKIASVLREASIPVAAIVDIDILDRQPHQDDLDTLMASLTDSDYSDLIDMRDNIYGAVECSNRNWKRENEKMGIKQLGIAGIPEGSRKEAWSLVSNATKFGLFVVPKGELEEWFPHSGKGSDWVIEALQKIDEDDYSRDLDIFIKYIDQNLRQQYSSLATRKRDQT